MRLTMALCAVVVMGLASGCGPRPGALITGKLEGGMFWNKPLMAANNEGGDYVKGSRVEIYDQFVMVTTPDGISHVHPHGFYSGLTLKKD